MILEFFAEVFPDAPLLPADHLLRAKARTFVEIYRNYVSSEYLGAFFLGKPIEGVLKALETLQAALPLDDSFIGFWIRASERLLAGVCRGVQYRALERFCTLSVCLRTTTLPYGTNGIQLISYSCRRFFDCSNKFRRGRMVDRGGRSCAVHRAPLPLPPRRAWVVHRGAGSDATRHASEPEVHSARAVGERRSRAAELQKDLG